MAHDEVVTMVAYMNGSQVLMIDNTDSYELLIIQIVNTSGTGPSVCRRPWGVVRTVFQYHCVSPTVHTQAYTNYTVHVNPHMHTSSIYKS